jgi:hypothetical protein
MTFARIRAPRFSGRAAVGALAIGVLVAAGAFTWFRIIRYVETAQPVAVTGQPTSVAWGDRVFSSPHKLEIWLRSRGVSYKAWVRRHPDAIGIIDPGSTPVSAPPEAKAPKVERRATVPVAKRSAARATGAGSGESRLVILAIALAMLLAGAAAVPERTFSRFIGRAPPRLEQRVYAVAVSASILIGVAAGAFPS